MSLDIDDTAFTSRSRTQTRLIDPPRLVCAAFRGQRGRTVCGLEVPEILRALDWVSNVGSHQVRHATSGRRAFSRQKRITKKKRKKRVREKKRKKKVSETCRLLPFVAADPTPYSPLPTSSSLTDFCPTSEFGRAMFLRTRVAVPF